MTILSRVRRIEAAIGKQSIGAVLLREPADDGNTENHLIFEQELTAALDSGQRVIVLTAGKSPSKRIPSVTYTSDSLEAFLIKLSLSPPTDGRSGDLLRQVIAEICASGSTLPVIAEVGHGEI